MLMELIVLCVNRGRVGCSELPVPLLHQVLHWMRAEVRTHLGMDSFHGIVTAEVTFR